MEITKTFKFEASHRLCDSYEQRCRGLHGHSYKVDIILAASTLNNAGVIMDFTEVKLELAGFLDAFDHALIIDHRDVALVDMAPTLNPRYVIVPYTPTAENMALHICTYCRHKGLPVWAVRVWETATAFAQATYNDIAHSENFIDLTKVRYAHGL